MRWKLVFLMLCSVVVTSGYCIPDTSWVQTYGGSDSEYAWDVQQTTDGGYIVVGRTMSFGAGSYDCYVVKTDSAGSVLWSQTFGGGMSDYARSVQLTSDGGYIIAGNTGSFGQGESDFYLLKIDEMGDSLWTRTYGGTDIDAASAVQQTQDGGYILAGYTYSFGTGGSDCYLVKANNLGATVWSNTIGSMGNEFAWAVQQTSDLGYIMVGRSSDGLYLVKTTTSGDSVWARTYGSPGDEAHSVQQTSDGGYIMAISQCRLFKTDGNGDSLWMRTYGGEELYSANLTQDGGCIAAGKTGSTQDDFYIVRTDSIGDTLWTMMYGGYDDESARVIRETDDSGYIVAGFTESYGAGSRDFYVLKTGPDRELQLTSPNGGEEWAITQPDTVRWIGLGFEGGVMIELNRNYPDGMWETLMDSTANIGWVEVQVTGPPSSHCRVRISALDEDLTDLSDADFSIVSTIGGYLALVRTSDLETAFISWDVTAECPLTVTENFFLKNIGDAGIVVFTPDSLGGPEFTSSNDCPSYFALVEGQVSACSITVTFDPSGSGIDRDTLLIMSDAVNAVDGYVRIPLSGQQSLTPATPNLMILIGDDDALLFWDSVTESIYGCPMTITGYLVFFSEEVSGPYWFHGYTTDTTYAHYGVIRFTTGMFYQITAFTEPLDGISALLADPNRKMLTRNRLFQLLSNSR